MEPSRRRILIVVFDALRPEFATPELMPNLYAFAQGGARFANSRSTFPTETRVNQSAVITGCYPWKHGIVANRFREQIGSAARVLDSGQDEELEATFARMGGRLIQVPTLGERLAAAGLTYASISSGTSGGGRLINHAAERSGAFRLALRRPEAAAPTGIFEKVRERLGPVPELEFPRLAWNSYAVDCYLDYVEREIAPDVMLLWLCEPDESFHAFGIGSEKSLRAIRHMDAEFGRILECRGDEIETGILQVVAMSDHGQIGLEGEALDLASRFAEVGFSAGPDDSTDCMLAVGNAGGVWVRDSDPQIVAALVEWLRGEEWCGPLFTREGAGDTLTLHELRAAHDRAPDIAFCMRHSDAPNASGRKGMSLHASRYPAGGGCHGGLSAYELRNFLAMSGSAVARGLVVESPAGNVDILPTVIDLLGLEVPKDIDGRVLLEALAGVEFDPVEEAREVLLTSKNPTGSVTHLSLTEFGSSRYINEAWVE